MRREHTEKTVRQQPVRAVAPHTHLRWAAPLLPISQSDWAFQRGVGRHFTANHRPSGGVHGWTRHATRYLNLGAFIEMWVDSLNDPANVFLLILLKNKREVLIAGAHSDTEVRRFSPAVVVFGLGVQIWHNRPNSAFCVLAIGKSWKWAVLGRVG